MNNSLEKIESTVNEKRVKLHHFTPSDRKIWTIVGKEKEHWLEPDFEFCSCPGFYFGMSKSQKPCYHLESIKLAKKEKKFETIEFSDDVYENFISGLISEL